MKYLQRALKQITKNKRTQAHLEKTYCNYSNNYYGDQHCITSAFKPGVVSSESDH